MSETIGSRIRSLREALGWSQQQLARKIPISQKQISRIEQAGVMSIPRATLVRIGEVLHQPIVTGELNRWLYHEGYRPYILPGLPLSPAAERLLALSAPYPAAVLDVGWYVSAVNPVWERLTGSGAPDDWPFRHLIAELIHPEGRLRGLVNEDDMVRLVARLVLEWAAFTEDDWVREAHTSLNSWLGALWEELWALAERSLAAGSAPVREEVQWLFGTNPPTRFRCRALAIPDRPDLRVLCYLPSLGRVGQPPRADLRPLAGRSPHGGGVAS